MNTDKKVSTSGFIYFQGGIVEVDTGFIMSKCQFESSMCFWILKPIDLIHILFLSYKCSYCGWKTQWNGGVSFSLLLVEQCNVGWV